MEQPISEPENIPSSTVSEDDSSLDRSFQSCTNSYDFCFHLINLHDQSIQSHFVNAQDNLTLEESLTILQDKIKKAMNNPIFRGTLEGDPLPSSTLLSECVKGPDQDLYIFYEEVKPIIKQVEKIIHYETLNKYSYLDDKDTVKVYIPFEGIGAHPADKISTRFLDKSFQIKIHDFNGKNWIFAVPRTQCSILTKKSKIIQKKDKIIVSLGKVAQGDNWFSLHRTRCVGDKQLD